MQNKEILRPYTVCFTGHRYIPESEKAALAVRLRKALVELIESGCRYFGAGGALGFDTLAAEVVLALREEYPHIKLILVLPCKDQCARWREEDVRVWENIRSRADKVVWVSQAYTPSCMYERNRRLVNSSAVCVCYLGKDVGGTAYTVKYALAQGLKVINLF